MASDRPIDDRWCAAGWSSRDRLISGVVRVLWLRPVVLLSDLDDIQRMEGSDGQGEDASNYATRWSQRGWSVDFQTAIATRKRA